MYLEIDDKRTIRELQDAFNAHYPFLKIEFFKTGHIWSAASSQADHIDANKTIGEIRGKHVPGLIEIFGYQKTGTVEQHFKRRFDLNVQVYRLQGYSWIQTAGTDDLTLQEQNEIGRKNSEPLLRPDLFDRVGGDEY